MRRHRALLIALCWSALLAACGPSAVPTATPPAPAAPPPSPTVPSPAATATPTGPAPEALAYLTEALDYMQAHALMRDRVDWVALRRQALTNARYARTPGETYTAIGLALQQLGDR
ncbi:MAG TPA: hypothetical protein VHN78_05085, partial [Chloroflexota bacterium]|nr:hypothetical protein [Chloroflexota bacterium]